MSTNNKQYTLDVQKTAGFVAIFSAHVCKLMLLCVFTPHHVHTYNVTGFSLLFGYDNAVVILF